MDDKLMDDKLIDAAHVAEHNSATSCWVILYGNVYDVTDFLSSHPGGPNVILRLAGKDATAEYDAIHPPGTLQDNLKPQAKLGRVDPMSLVGQARGTKTEHTPSSVSWSSADEPPPLQSLLNLDDVEQEASKRLSKRAWAYYFSAADDLFSKKFNSAVYQQLLLRPRVFVDCSVCNVSTSVLGHGIGVPFYIAPAAMARLAHPDGEHAMARAAARFGAMQIVSNNASMAPEHIVQGAPPSQVFGYQIYVQTQRAKSEALIKRINALRHHFKFLCLTLDAPVPGKREHDERGNLTANEPLITHNHGGLPAKGGIGKQLFLGTAADLTWATTLPWLANHTDLPIVLKGLQTHQDVHLAAQYAPQVKAVILSNHGGRALDTAPPAIHTLLEIHKYCPDVFGRIEIWIDGGIKRGTDIVKALCLGAKAVGLGRAPLYGLGVRGQAGVERVFEILEAEMATCMRLLGAKSIAELGPIFINSRHVERDIYDGDPGLDKRVFRASTKL
ncbi:hypothetical protein CDD82_3958 [Ophiocordyceps australis]|uniref:L-lactate dehydrogenase (cytochrome) n=1 Tax=Ophiocordyceps australis TaxID=1399860 RepID=A0A2C5YEJ9_9HYPO|nr:hypothetical protein CDD82_3958 [Ophiocordyceps australis]